MIIAKLMGGLGNQMFQYAAARRLALKHGTEVVLDASYFSHCPPVDTPRQFELGNLSVRKRFATPLEAAEMSGLCNSVLLNVRIKLRRFLGTGIKSKLYREAPGNFCHEALDLPDNVYLLGYWQSERYFQGISAILREEFKVNSPLEGINKDFAAKISATEAVAVHFRRGDYISSVKTAAVHCNLTESYYDHAVKELCQTVDNPHLYVFSDDPAWVRKSISFPVPATIVDHNSPDQCHEDLRLMTLCRHAIIANSSFSWWGAWLIDNPSKVVIAPQRWFSDQGMQSKDLIPPDWLQVAND